MKIKRTLTSSALGAVALSSLVGAPAQANTFVVNDCDGFDTALETANNSFGADTIVVNCDLQIDSAITIEDDLVINGSGELIFSGSGMVGVGSNEFTLDGLDISGSTTTDAFYALAGSIELKNLKVENFHSERGLIRTQNGLLDLSEIVVQSSTANDFFVVTDGGTINAAKMKITDLDLSLANDSTTAIFRSNDSDSFFNEIYADVAWSNNGFVITGGETELSSVFIKGNFNGNYSGLSNIGLFFGYTDEVKVTNSTFTGTLVGALELTTSSNSNFVLSQNSFFYNYWNLISLNNNSHISMFGNFFGEGPADTPFQLIGGYLRSFGANVCESSGCISELDLAVADAGLTVPIHWNTDDYSDWVPGTMFEPDSPLANVIPSDVYSGLDSGSAEFQDIFGAVKSTDIRGAARGEYFDVGATEFSAESTFEIQLVSQGRNYRDPLVVDSGESVNLPKPSRQGYEFRGWYQDEDFSDPVPYEFTPLSDTVLFAKWSRIDFDVVLHLQNGEFDHLLQYVPGDDPLNLPTPIRPGYEFLGWFSQENGGTLIGSSITPNENVDLFAQWKQIMVAKRFSIETDIRFGIGKSNLGWLTKSQMQNELSKITAVDGTIVKVVVTSDKSSNKSTEKLLNKRLLSISNYFKSKNVNVQIVFKTTTGISKSSNELELKVVYIAQVPLLESEK